MWTISLPLAVAVSSKKEFILNLNRYRNAHFHVLNKAKAEFERMVTPLLKDIPKLTRVTLEYVYYHGKGAEPDTNNVCTVADKFFADTLVKAGILQDDSRKYLASTTFTPGGVDRGSPRVDVTIRNAHVPPTVPREPATERKHPMKFTSLVTVTKDEVQEALKDFLIKRFPQVSAPENMVFNLAQDGSYETRMEMDLSQVASGAAKARPTPAEAARVLSASAETKPAAASSEPQVAPSAAQTASPSPVPVSLPAMQAAPAEPQEATSGQATEPPQASAATPEGPPPTGGKASLFAKFPRVSN